MSDPLNTHTYDGQIKNILPNVMLCINEQKIRGNELLNVAKMNSIAMHHLKCIVNNIGDPINIDTTNHLNADHLISLCWLLKDNPYFMEELEIQLTDMQTGFCPQGRTHRLYQILILFF